MRVNERLLKVGICDCCCGYQIACLSHAPRATWNFQVANSYWSNTTCSGTLLSQTLWDSLWSDEQLLLLLGLWHSEIGGTLGWNANRFVQCTVQFWPYPISRKNAHENRRRPHILFLKSTPRGVKFFKPMNERQFPTVSSPTISTGTVWQEYTRVQVIK